MNFKTYKHCIVPQCENTAQKTPNKLFITVPSNKEIRKKWLHLAGIDHQCLSTKLRIYFCEDHFDVAKDTKGKTPKIIIPNKFECQRKEQEESYSITGQLSVKDTSHTSAVNEKLKEPEKTCKSKERFKAISVDTDPLLLLRKEKKGGKELIVVLQKLDVAQQKIADGPQSAIQLEDPLKCAEVDPLDIISRNASIKLTESNINRTSKSILKVIEKDLSNAVENTEKTIKSTLSDKINLEKVKFECISNLKRLVKPVILNHNVQFAKPSEVMEQMETGTQTNIKSHTASSTQPWKQIKANSEKDVHVIQQKGRGLVMSLKSVKCDSAEQQNMTVNTRQEQEPIQVQDQPAIKCTQNSPMKIIENLGVCHNGKQDKSNSANDFVVDCDDVNVEVEVLEDDILDEELLGNDVPGNVVILEDDELDNTLVESEVPGTDVILEDDGLNNKLLENQVPGNVVILKDDELDNYTLLVKEALGTGVILEGNIVLEDKLPEDELYLDEIVATELPKGKEPGVGVSKVPSTRDTTSNTNQVNRNFHNRLTVESQANLMDSQVATDAKALAEKWKAVKMHLEKSSVLRVATQATNPRLSSSAVPVFKDGARWYMENKHSAQFTETIKNKPTVQKKVQDTLDKVPTGEAERMKSINKSFLEEVQTLKATIRSLEKQLKKQMVRIKTLKTQLVAAKPRSRTHAFELLTKNLSEDVKMLFRMQITQCKRRPKARRFSLKEKLFALALYKFSSQAYRFLGTVLALPTTHTLNKYLNKLHTELLVKDDAAINDSQINETEAAVASISTEAVSNETDAAMEVRVEDTDNNHRIECSENPITYFNIEDGFDAEYIQSDTTNFNSHVNEEGLSAQFTDQTNENRQVTEVPTSYGTIRFGYDNVQEQTSAVSDPAETLSSKETLPNNTTNLASNQLNKKSAQDIINEKKTKIDFVLRKLMTPDDLNKVFVKSKKKVKKNINKVMKPNKISKPRVIAKQKTKNVNSVSKVSKQKRDLKKVNPLSHQTRNDTVYMDQPFMPHTLVGLKPGKTQRYNSAFNVLGPKHIQNLPGKISYFEHNPQSGAGFNNYSFMNESVPETNRVVSDMYNSVLNILGTTTKHNINSLENASFVHPAQTVFGGSSINHIPERPAGSVGVIRNEDDSEVAVDTVTKLRRNLEKYSPKALGRNTSYTEGSDGTSQRTASEQPNDKLSKNVTDKKKDRKTVIRKKGDIQLEKKPIKRKLARKLVIDESRFSEDAPGKYPSPDIFVLGTRDHRPTNVAMNSNLYGTRETSIAINSSQDTARVRGIDMPNLSEDSYFDDDNRKRTGSKRLPTNPY